MTDVNKLFQNQLQQYMQQYGVTDPTKLFGGSSGLIKIDTGDIAYDPTGGLNGSSYENAINKLATDLLSNNTELANKFYQQRTNSESPKGPLNLFDLSVGGSNTGGAAANREGTFNDIFNSPDYQLLKENPDFYNQFQSKKEALDKQYTALSGKSQITPELLYRTVLQNSGQSPNGSEGSWLKNVNDVNYSPELGLYLQKDLNKYPESNGWNGGGYVNGGGNFFTSTFTDPQFLLAAGGLLGIGLSGAAAAGGAALGGEAGAGTAGAAGAGELGGSSLYSLGSGGGSLGIGVPEGAGWWGAGSGIPATGFTGSAAGWGGFGPAFEGLGSLGGAINYGLGSGSGNLGFNASGAFGGTPSLGGTAGGSLGIGTPGSAGWWGAGTGLQAPTVGSLSMLDQAKAAYDKYVKPLKQVKSGLDLLNGGSSGGGQYPIGQGQQPEQDYGTAPTTYYPPVDYQNYGMGNGPLPNVGGNPQLPNVGGGSMAGYFDYLPDYIKKGVIQKRFAQ